MTTKERYQAVLEHFRKEMPEVDTELHYASVYQLLVAVVLSAQCTDKRVNMVTPALFAAYPTPQAMAEAGEAEVYEYVKSVSYPNAKARHIVQLSDMLVKDFGGEVPSDMDQLMRLPGVGRKTANVMQAVAFRKNAMPVDTHVFRVSHRLGLVPKSCNTPYKVEQELLRNIERCNQDDKRFSQGHKPCIPHPTPAAIRQEWLAADAHHWLLLHGRYICKSLKPLCSKCPFDPFCPKLLEGSKL